MQHTYKNTTQKAIQMVPPWSQLHHLKSHRVGTIPRSPAEIFVDVFNSDSFAECELHLGNW